MATINDDLKLVLPITDNVRAYHSPISREVFEQNFRVLAATKAALFSKGSQYAASVGTTVAALTLLDEGKRLAEDEEGDGGANALLLEIKRLTTILCPSANGYDQIPVDVAIKQGAIDADDWREVEATLVFFTSIYALAKKAQRKPAMDWICSITGGSSTALTPVEYAASFPTSKTDDATETREGSSVPV